MPQGLSNAMVTDDDVKRERRLARTPRTTGASVARARKYVTCGERAITVQKIRRGSVFGVEKLFQAFESLNELLASSDFSSTYELPGYSRFEIGLYTTDLHPWSERETQVGLRARV